MLLQDTPMHEHVTNIPCKTTAPLSVVMLGVAAMMAHRAAAMTATAPRGIALL